MKTKSLLLLICMVFILLPLQAKKVELGKAEKLAQNFLQSKHKLQTKSDVRLRFTATNKAGSLRSGTGSLQNVEDTVYYYVFNVNENTKGGFVIVAGDDAVKPVLGYSDNGNYDENNLPPNFAYWMDYLQSQIAYAQTHNLPQSNTIKNEWDNYLNGNVSYSTSAVEPLIKTKWDQGAPYNNLCPIINGTTTPTGCVATAMAQIMKYYNFPTSGSGQSMPYTTPSGINMPSASFEQNYDWANMLNTYTGSETPQQQSAIAMLMHQCGLSVSMQYNTFESDAYNEAVTNALTNNFGYDRNMQIIYKSKGAWDSFLGWRPYGDTEWEALLRAQIDANIPVYYAGLGSISHAFICDGYDYTGKFHFNWGWSGQFDGYFVTSALNPDASDFNSNQLIITNIKPVQSYLNQLNINEGILSPAFRPYIFDYTVHVETSVESIDIKGITDFSNATVTGNVTNLPLKLNDYTDVSIKVTLSDGNSQTYKVSVMRGNIPNASYTIKIDDHGKTISNFVGVVSGEVLYINWGDGTVPDKIITNNEVYSISNFPEYFIYGNLMHHTYSNAGEYQVTFYGENELICPLLTLWQNAQGCPAMNFDDGVYLSQIDMRKASQLRVLFVEEGNIPNLNVSHNTDLEDLYCNNIQLSELDVSNNRKLLKLECSSGNPYKWDTGFNNQLTSLDVSNATGLRILMCEYNKLSELIGYNNSPMLWNFHCERNLLKNLDVSHNLALTELNCADNQLANLDVSHNLVLNGLFCGDNQLINLDVSHNPLLTALNCGIMYSGRGNQLTNLDVSKNTALTILNCTGNQLTNLDVSDNTKLILLQCGNNQLTNLDVSKHPALSFFECWSNQLTKLDVSKNPLLNTFYCDDNQLTELDISNNSTLNYFSCSENSLTKLDVSHNLKLLYLHCGTNLFINLDVSQNSDLNDLACDNNKLTNLDVSHNPALNTLYCMQNSISLANLYELSQKVSDPNNKYLGYQFLPDTTVAINASIAIDTVFHGINSVFNVSYGVLGTNYKLNNGEITFFTSGDYWVSISNPAITSSSHAPAEVAQMFHVTDNTGINNIPQVKPLNVWIQDGTLHVSGLTASRPWSVCNAAGTIVYQGVALGDVETLRATSLPHGAYIIQSGKEAIKVMF